MTYAILLGSKLLLAWRVIHVQSSSPRSTLATYAGAQFTIVQPILSGDPLLEIMLSTNVDQLPQAQFLWMIDADDRTAQTIAERIVSRMAASNQSRVRVVECPPAPHDVNPKSFKLQLALGLVATWYLVVLDDDTVIEESSLVAAQVNLVDYDLTTGLPSYRRGTNLWSDLVAHFVNNNSVLTYLPLLNFTPPLSINGMYYVAQTSTLRELGGFAAIQHWLCDDYAVAQWFRSRGKRIHQSITRQLIATSLTTCADYQKLMHRWMSFALLLTRDQPLSLQLALGLLLGLPPLLLTLTVLSAVFSVPGMMILLILLVTRHLAIGAIQRQAFGQPLSTNPLVSILAELLQPLHILSAAVIPYIWWRGKLVRVARDHSFQQL